MHRLYVPPGQLDGAARVKLTPAQSRHLLSVLRLTSGAEVEVFDGRGGRFQAVLTGDELEIGNGLPDGVWLTSLRADRATLALEGRSTRLAAVGAMLTDLARLAPYAGVRLIAVHEEPNRSRLTYAIALDRRP